MPSLHDQSAPAPKREFAFSDKDFRFLVDLINQCTGIVLADQKRDMVYGRLASRLRKLGLKSFEDYCSRLKTHEEEELGELVNAITTNLTSFFREIHHFKHLAEHVLAPLAKDPLADRRLRLWSAACSSGMEPYSMAMTLKNAVPEINRWNARILATDIDSNMIAAGSAGDYDVAEEENIPASYRRFTSREGKPAKLRMDQNVKELITFRQLNLLSDWPMKGMFDAVFCRNVVIYFDKPTKRELFDRMADVIKPDGWLYIGHSENLHDISDRFELVGKTIYRKVA